MPDADVNHIYDYDPKSTGRNLNKVENYKNGTYDVTNLYFLCFENKVSHLMKLNEMELFFRNRGST